MAGRVNPDDNGHHQVAVPVELNRGDGREAIGQPSDSRPRLPVPPPEPVKQDNGPTEHCSVADYDKTKRSRLPPQPEPAIGQPGLSSSKLDAAIQKKNARSLKNCPNSNDPTPKFASVAIPEFSANRRMVIADSAISGGPKRADSAVRRNARDGLADDPRPPVSVNHPNDLRIRHRCQRAARPQHDRVRLRRQRGRPSAADQRQTSDGSVARGAHRVGCRARPSPGRGLRFCEALVGHGEIAIIGVVVDRPAIVVMRAGGEALPAFGAEYAWAAFARQRRRCVRCVRPR